ncbi:hypothetical protein A1Q1_06281 [Trichosporon asahii var. asahii CBS 2479]|uniref:Uncharacterized protein n=1 Tax=Trichosporon asahii var. asahii (strain ATCC 90039 / CBS 2479 / JCM 2466 / KCTC 7840 / NBRC 103889/ NCYC 2677 / UAMH 7654) TaxID=1186058 RepID=J4UK08_TRIAS|nr:hypothetical protein A1Q1_06281 [Trichosporon asahii var. asahii CBS 2479]EJT52175.1 hypothetical protein A1Q1_06281 [Trichosporon asahii var. asahii CBS 2479]
MYIGHFAIAVLAHALLRDVHALPLLLGTSFLDLLDGLLAFPGVTQVRANANAGPYLFYDLIFIDWDHSLSAAAFWSLVCLPLCLAAGYEQRTALATAAVCLSHWLADWPMHNHDLALYPHSERHFGGALWSRLGTWSWILEGLLSALCLIFAARQRQMSKWVPVTFAVLFLQLSPWAAPTQFAASLSGNAASRLYGVLIVLGFIGPSLLLAKLLGDTPEPSAKQKSS